MEPTNGVESEATGTGAGAPLSHAASLPVRPEVEGEVERNPIFDVLVGSDEEDVAGLVGRCHTSQVIDDVRLRNVGCEADCDRAGPVL